MYNPQRNEQVIIDHALLKKRKEKRIGTIINIFQRREAKDKYIEVFIIRTAYNDVVSAKLGQFRKLKRRHLEGVPDGKN